MVLTLIIIALLHALIGALAEMVKALDFESNGFCPRGFESHTLRGFHLSLSAKLSPFGFESEAQTADHSMVGCTNHGVKTQRVLRSCARISDAPQPLRPVFREVLPVEVRIPQGQPAPLHSAPCSLHTQ